MKLSPSPSHTGLVTPLLLLNNQDDPSVMSRTYKPRIVLWVVKEYSDSVYSANVPSGFGSADPRRGALSIDSGVRSAEHRDVFISDSTKMRRDTGEAIRAIMI